MHFFLLAKSTFLTRLLFYQITLKLVSLVTKLSSVFLVDFCNSVTVFEKFPFPRHALLKVFKNSFQPTVLESLPFCIYERSSLTHLKGRLKGGLEPHWPSPHLRWITFGPAFTAPFVVWWVVASFEFHTVVKKSNETTVISWTHEKEGGFLEKSSFRPSYRSLKLLRFSFFPPWRYIPRC